jgi:hypothetical protein
MGSTTQNSLLPLVHNAKSSEPAKISVASALIHSQPVFRFFR